MFDLFLISLYRIIMSFSESTCSSPPPNPDPSAMMDVSDELNCPDQCLVDPRTGQELAKLMDDLPTGVGASSILSVDIDAISLLGASAETNPKEIYPDIYPFPQDPIPATSTFRSSPTIETMPKLLPHRDEKTPLGEITRAYLQVLQMTANDDGNSVYYLSSAYDYVSQLDCPSTVRTWAPLVVMLGLMRRMEMYELGKVVASTLLYRPEQ